MLKHAISFMGLLVMAGAVPAVAQEPRVEVSGFGGWTFSDGVEGDDVLAGDGNLYNRVDADDSGMFGFSVGVLVIENGEVGFIFGRQPSTLVLGDTADRELGDLSITTYHAYFGYNFGAADSHIRPFVFGGAGATSFGNVDVTIAGVDRTISGQTKFSTTWGGGVKVFFTPHVGVRLAGRWTPTYIKSDSAGWWCDPFWGCYVVGDAQYANQFDLTGGVTVRF